MRIAFLNSPPLKGNAIVEAEDCCWGRSKSRVLPSMLLSCAVEARAADHKASYFDLSIPDQVGAVVAWMPDIIVYGLPWQYHREVHQQMVKLFPRVHHVVLAVPPGYAEDYRKLDPAPTAVLGSEPERMMGLIPNGKWAAWEKATRKVQPACFHELGPIDYSSLVSRRYWPHYVCARYQVTRGCPYRCRFCVWGGSTVTDPAFRMRPARIVADDLRQLREVSAKYRDSGAIPLYLLAAQLTTSPKWLEEFSDLMGDDPYFFQSNINLGEVTEENTRLLKKAGLASVSAGLEATSDRTLKMIGKPYTLERATRSILILQKNFGRVRLHVRTGFGETGDDVMEALKGLRYMKRQGVDGVRVDLAPLVHYKGTVIRERADYPLEQLPGYDVESLVMANQPVAWERYADQLRSYGWLTRWGLSK